MAGKQRMYYVRYGKYRDEWHIFRQINEVEAYIKRMIDVDIDGSKESIQRLLNDITIVYGLNVSARITTNHSIEFKS